MSIEFLNALPTVDSSLFVHRQLKCWELIIGISSYLPHTLTVVSHAYWHITERINLRKYFYFNWLKKTVFKYRSMFWTSESITIKTVTNYLYASLYSTYAVYWILYRILNFMSLFRIKYAFYYALLILSRMLYSNLTFDNYCNMYYNALDEDSPLNRVQVDTLL